MWPTRVPAVLGVVVLACVMMFGVVSSARAASPTIATSASGAVGVGGVVFDTAALSGGVNPTGTVTFRLYWPGDTACTHAPVFTSTNAVSAAAATSGAFAVRTAGVYRWTASYSGDANNVAVVGPCNDGNESVSVSKASPSLMTNASGTVTLGGQISDMATLSGAFDGDFVPCAIFSSPGVRCVDGARPPPTVFFAAYGPDDPGCRGTPAFTSWVFKPGSANGSYISPSFTPSAAGSYRWTAVYEGDGNNNFAAAPCDAPNESVLVAPPASGADTSGADTTRPVLTALSASPDSFRAAGSGASIASVVGSRISFTLSEAASVGFRVERRLPGRRVRGHCVRPERSNRGARKCTRYVTLRGSFTFQGHPGANTFRFTGRLQGRKLAPGRYRLRAEATDPAANKSPLKAIAFQIVLR